MLGPQRHGPTLPYTLVAGVVPCPPGWLVAGAKLQGASIAPEPPRVLGSFMDVIDDRPAFSAVGLYAPVGLPDESVSGGRTCDREARALLGRRRGAAIRSAPSRPTLDLVHRDLPESGNGSTKVLRHRYREVAREMAPYRQRTVFEVHPELTFYQLNEDRPLQYRKRSIHGQNERRALLSTKIPGVERILDARVPGVRRTHLLDAAACMWTARRIMGRAMTRLPLDPEWDGEGLRMEIIR
jgi:predicted RNase H-like nuclease